MRLSIQAELDYHFDRGTDVLLAMEAAPLRDQRLLEDRLVIDGSGPLQPVPGEDDIGRRTWLRAEGPFRARYSAIVDVERAVEPLDALEIASPRDLPAHVIPYIWPSRYCESDKFESFVERSFGAFEGGARILAMTEWMQAELDYMPGASDVVTTAADTFVSRRGVCRDYAHLLAAFARAAGVPARLVSAYALKLDPPDFHAVVELWLGGGWRLVDASCRAPVEGLVRICVGRDATDIAFMTSFGPAVMKSQRVGVERLPVEEPASRAV